jgi:hypothetical protein
MKASSSVFLIVDPRYYIIESSSTRSSCGYSVYYDFPNLYVLPTTNYSTMISNIFLTFNVLIRLSSAPYMLNTPFRVKMNVTLLNVL